MADPRIVRLREMMTAAGDPADAVQQKNYLKSGLQFHGIKTEARRAIVREVFPGPEFPRSEYEPLIRELWGSDWFDDTAVALGLLNRLLPQLKPADLPWLHEITRGCEGWAQLDSLACYTLGPLAVTYGEAVYKPVRRWSADDWMWTRRAAILTHLVPGQKQQLNDAYSWPTFEERLFEKEFFIRKAIGWTLREIGKHYPREVHDFLVRAGDAASGLTRREGARNLPDEFRIPILGK